MREAERQPLEDEDEFALIRRELCACGDVLVLPHNARPGVVEAAIHLHNQRLRHRRYQAWQEFEQWPGRR